MSSSSTSSARRGSVAVDASDLQVRGLDALRDGDNGTIGAAELVAVLAATDAALLADDAEVLDLVAACERLSSWAQGPRSGGARRVRPPTRGRPRPRRAAARP